jgi:hypothetical protein
MDSDVEVLVVDSSTSAPLVLPNYSGLLIIKRIITSLYLLR